MDSSSLSKRGKAPTNTNIAHCLVDGCDADLRLCRDYHRRHKVCEAHSKTPKVTIAGREQRFCQQCSRFHSLVEFDEGKRSCRKRLDGHNRRRRKPQPPESTNPGLVFSSQPGGLLSFSSPQSQIVPSWAGVLKSESHDIMLYNTTTQQQIMNYNMDPEQNSFPGQNFKLGNQLQSSTHVCCLDPHAAAALSLLSPTPAHLNHVAVEPLVLHGLHYYPYGEGSKAAGTSEGGSGSHQTLTFTWE